MNLPGHFLADLPPEATVTPGMIAEALLALRRNRDRAIGRFSTESIAGVIAETARQWRREDYPFRQLALSEGPAATGFSRETIAHGLDTFFAEWTLDSIHALLVQDLGAASRLDQFSAAEPAGAGRPSGRRLALASSPDLLVHITAGNLPVSAMTSLLFGVLLRSAQFLKCATSGALFPRLLAHSLADTEPSLAGALELATWPGGTAELEEALFAEADLVTAAGTDATLASLQARVAGRERPPRWVGYGHRVSFAYVTREALGGFERARTIENAALDVAAWDQCGCLSPHVIYVETGGAIPPDSFAEALAAALDQRELSHPRGPLPTDQAATIHLKREFYAIRAAAAPGPDTPPPTSPSQPGRITAIPGTETRVWHSHGSTAWTVVLEADPRFQMSCQNRFIYVKPVPDLDEVFRAADPVRRQVSTVGLAAASHRAPDLATRLARWGVSRVCPLGRMQQPPLTWRHDGRPALGDLIRWTDLELD